MHRNSTGALEKKSVTTSIVARNNFFSVGRVPNEIFLNHVHRSSTVVKKEIFFFLRGLREIFFFQSNQKQKYFSTIEGRASIEFLQSTKSYSSYTVATTFLMLVDNPLTSPVCNGTVLGVDMRARIFRSGTLHRQKSLFRLG